MEFDTKRDYVRFLNRLSMSNAFSISRGVPFLLVTLLIRCIPLSILFLLVS